MMRTIFVSTVAILGALSPMATAFVHAPWAEELYQYIGDTYDANVDKRARYLQDMILTDEAVTQQQMLKDVNNFFNQVQWVSDQLHWGKKDYWQTPMETLIEFKGDCEDIAIAKYTALRIMGIPEKNLALVYAFINKEPHMVLAYYPEHHAEPYILDSYVREIKHASQRQDLVSVYEFNTTSVWLTDTHFIKKSAAKPEHLALVDEVKQRIHKNRDLLKSHNHGEPTVPFSFDTL